ncbi:tetratricopeptide repeat protein [Minwuia sp.]|uniref:tetratricopeptide repeat protein n=1 Tax=Minwuia sp. TaxID=2493630 RepID=UPI003A94C968
MNLKKQKLAKAGEYETMIKAVRTTLISIAALSVFGLGVANADIKQGDKLYAEGNYKDALQQYVDAGGEGDVEATFRAAQMFEKGEGTGEPRYEKAVAWYQVAARAGHLGALHQLSDMFAEGRGVDADKVQAWTLLNIAANRGDAEAAKKRDALAADLRPGQLAAGERRTQKLAPKYQGS